MSGRTIYTYVGGNPISRIDPEGLDWLDDASNFSAGFGDTLSFGLTSYIRDQWDIGGVDKCSGAYAAGMYAELGLEVGLTGASFALRGAAKGISQAAARRGQNWHGVRGVSAVHHINPLKEGLFPTAALPQAIRNSRLNLEKLTTAEHTAAHANLARHDKYLATLFNRATTTARGVTGMANQCGCQ